MTARSINILQEQCRRLHLDSGGSRSLAAWRRCMKAAVLTASSSADTPCSRAHQALQFASSCSAGLASNKLPATSRTLHLRNLHTTMITACASARCRSDAAPAARFGGHTTATQLSTLRPVPQPGRQLRQRSAAATPVRAAQKQVRWAWWTQGLRIWQCLASEHSFIFVLPLVHPCRRTPPLKACCSRATSRFW